MSIYPIHTHTHTHKSHTFDAYNCTKIYIYYTVWMVSEHEYRIHWHICPVSVSGRLCLRHSEREPSAAIPPPHSHNHLPTSSPFHQCDKTVLSLCVCINMVGKGEFPLWLCDRCIDTWWSPIPFHTATTHSWPAQSIESIFFFGCYCCFQIYFLCAFLAISTKTITYDDTLFVLGQPLFE